MKPFALFSLSLLALPIAACKEKADAVEHNHDDLLRTIEEQQEELGDQAAAVVPTIATLISSTSIVAFFAWLLSGIATLVSLVSVFRGPQMPAEA